MRDMMVELEQLHLHGMVGAWDDLLEQGGDAGLENARWLVEHLLQAEVVSPVDRRLVMKLAEMEFTDQTQKVVLVGGPGTRKTHLATALDVAGVTKHGKRVRFHSTVDLVNALEREKGQGRAGRIAESLLRMDLVILDELGYLPFSQPAAPCFSTC